MTKCPHTDEQIKAALPMSFEVFEQWMKCRVVWPGTMVTADYRPEKRDRFFPEVRNNQVVGGSFG